MKINKIMIILLSIVVTLILILLIGKINLSNNFKGQVNELLKQSQSISNKKYSTIQLKELPEPVTKYFSHVLKEGQPYISYIRMTHSGQFKLGINKDWISITGEQYATTEKPGYIWKGTTSMFVARDMYISDKGRLVASIFSVYNILDANGPQYDQGELLRWLGESILYPTNLLPSDRLKWLAIDANTSKLVFNYNRLDLYFKVTFNELGEIIEMETKRYMDPQNLETWIIKISNYKRINNVLIPTYFEVLWRLKGGDFSYAKFTFNKIEYDIPKMF